VWPEQPATEGDGTMNTHDKVLAALLELGNFGTRRTRSELTEHALRTALVLTDADAAVALPPTSRRGERLVLHADSAVPAVVPAAESGSEVARAMAEDATPLLLADLTDEARWMGGDRCPGVEAGPAMYMPLRQRDPAVGYLAVYRRRGRARFTAADRNAMLLLSTWLAIALEGLRNAGGAEKLVRDGDTEVYNARFLRTALKRELRRAARYGQELSVVRVEVDGRDGLREAKGPQRQGALMRELAELLSQQVRSFDLLAHAGEDFVLMLPQTGRDGALEVAERVIAAVEHHAFSTGPAGTVTVSCGVSVFPREGADDKALLNASERALAEARKLGPSRIGRPDERAA
jgi:diguanylate cyclase (GGDEF)-like protein